MFSILLFCGALTFFVPGGNFQRDQNGNIITDTYKSTGVSPLAFWRVITAPFRVFASEDAVTIIAISLFLLIMSGVFNLIEKTGGIKIFISGIIKKLKNKDNYVICVTVLIFMLFGSLFGMFEELVTLLPIIIMFMLSMNMDSMLGLGACLLASCFGFSAAITNPFSVALASSYAGVPTSSGVWLRILFFIVTYIILCGFLLIYLKMLRRNPKISPSYKTDLIKKEHLSLPVYNSHSFDQKIYKVYSVFFIIQGVVLLLIAFVRTVSDFAIPILSASFLICGIVCGLIITKSKKFVFHCIFKGAVSMLPAVFMIALASSVKLVMTEGNIIDTIMNSVINILDGKNKFTAIILIYLLIIFLQLFIGSASAKIVLIMPIILPIATVLNIPIPLIILTYCMADGFTDVIMPTNPVLLIGLSMADVSYFKWVKWTWKLQLLVFSVSLLILFFGVTVL